MRLLLHVLFIVLPICKFDKIFCRIATSSRRSHFHFQNVRQRAMCNRMAKTNVFIKTFCNVRFGSVELLFFVMFTCTMCLCAIQQNFQFDFGSGVRRHKMVNCDKQLML